MLHGLISCLSMLGLLMLGQVAGLCWARMKWVGVGCARKPQYCCAVWLGLALLAWLDLAWICLALLTLDLLSFTWLGLAWLGLAWPCLALLDLA
jgi:hypothetical protein